MRPLHITGMGTGLGVLSTPLRMIVLTIYEYDSFYHLFNTPLISIAIVISIFRLRLQSIGPSGTLAVIPAKAGIHFDPSHARKMDSSAAADGNDNTSQFNRKIILTIALTIV